LITEVVDDWNLDDGSWSQRLMIGHSGGRVKGLARISDGVDILAFVPLLKKTKGAARLTALLPL
jgi:hypothetical protein